MVPTPAFVREIRAAAAAAGFGLSCDDDVGRLLSVLAAAVPADGRILELGTGVGVGTAWLVHGVAGRSDVAITTVETDEATAAIARGHKWPGVVEFVVGDVVTVLPALGAFDLIFADAPGGKWVRLDLTLAALRPAGVLVVDDMTPQAHWDEEQRANQEQVRRTLLGRPDLASVGLSWATGVIVCAKRPA